MTELKVKLIDIKKIRPNPFQPRESFPKEELERMAETIKNKHIGLLQPISVRKEGDTYVIISGERRWRACAMAGLKKIPAIIKDVTDAELMAQSLIENVHRKDLEPVEKAKGLAEVYKLAGFDPVQVINALKGISYAVSTGRKLKPHESRVKEIADMIGLNYDYQYELLSILKLPPAERKLVSKLKLGYEKIATIATIKKPEERRELIKIAPELKREEVKKVSKILKIAPEPIKRATLERKITPRVAEKVLELPKEKQAEAIKQVRALRLTEEEAIAHIEAMKVKIPPLPLKEIEKIRERYEKLRGEIAEIISRPEVKERGILFRNWLSHTTISGILESLRCPICGADWKKFGWMCHSLNVKKALKLAEEKYQKSVKGEKK